MIQVQIDDRIRLVASILLLTDFVNENSGFKPHPLKVQTIDYIKAHEGHPCATVSRDIAKSHWMDAFYHYAVMLDQKSFKLKRGAVAIGYDTHHMEDFEGKGYSDLLLRFYEDTKIDSFWDQTGDLWRGVQLDCERCLQGSGLDEFLSLFFGASDYQMAFVPNPVDPPTFGFGPNDGTNAYCIFGPPTVPLSSKDPVTYASFGRDLAYCAFHEFAHSHLYNALEKYPAVIDETRSMGAMMTLKGYFPKSYETWSKQFNEIFIRAATALYCERLEGEASARAMLDKEKRDFGIDVIDRMFWCLRDYLYARRRCEYHSLSEYLPSLSEKLASSTVRSP